VRVAPFARLAFLRGICGVGILEGPMVCVAGGFWVWGKGAGLVLVGEAEVYKVRGRRGGFWVGVGT
jgi:hypothetical protein